MRAFAHKGARDFDDGYWLRVIHGSTEKRLDYCQDEDGNCVVPSYSGTLWWYSNKSRVDEIQTYSIRLEKFYRIGSQWVFQSLLVTGVIPGGKEEDQARQAVFLTPLSLVLQHGSGFSKMVSEILRQHRIWSFFCNSS